MKPRIYIDGEHGTTGLQIRNRIAARPDLEMLSIPEAERRNNQMRADLLGQADIAILCLPDEGSREAVAMLDGNNSARIIDTSTAHRVSSEWVYGFAEMEPGQGEKIAAARQVANPGCYPTGAVGLVRPLVQAGILPADHPATINAVSGYTGGGKNMIAQMEDPNHPDRIEAPHFLYALGLQHKHVPEIQAHGLLERRPLFSPSVGRFPQGMIVQVPLYLDELNGPPDARSVHAALADHYAGQEIVQVVALEESARLPRISATELENTDIMKIHVFGTEDTGHVNLVAVLDNLGKGASGAAVQNMDLMLGNATGAGR